jgi:hypothetical protein
LRPDGRRGAFSSTCGKLAKCADAVHDPLMEQLRSFVSVICIGAAAVFGIFVSPVMAGQDCECLGNGKRIKEGGVICLQIGSSTTLSGALRTQSQQYQLEEDFRRLPGVGSITRADVTVAGCKGCPEKGLTRQKPKVFKYGDAKLKIGPDGQDREHSCLLLP